RLSRPFFVIATQNPVEFRGTYPLPEAQMDRFGMQLALGYVERMDEIAILSAQQGDHPVDTLAPCASLADIENLIRASEEIRVSEEIMGYAVDLVAATRDIPEVQLAASPRAALTLMKAGRALALFDGRAFVTPDDIQELAPEVIAHRLVLDSQAKFSGLTARQIIDEVLASIPVPA
ncbi:MAG: MoxR-like ATPase, partial [Verrucomicrobiales bacterium]